MKSRRTTGNRRKGGRHSSRQHLLELNVRTASVRRQRRNKVAGLLWKVSVLLFVLAAAGFGARVLALRFFFDNPEYDLKHLKTRLCGVMTEEELIALTGLKPGKNVFRLDLREAQRRLNALPEVKSAHIERQLPDTVEVGIERRLPLFLLAPATAGTDAESAVSETFVPGKSLLCDREGFVMQPARLADEFLHLPVLAGIDSSAFQPGQRVADERFLTAVVLAEALSDLPEESFRIRSVDVSLPYATVVTDASNARFTFGPKDLPGQIDRLRKLLAHCQESGRKISTANLMIQRNTPVTFVLTPENRAAKITPVPTPAKKQAKH